ncbi:DMT family transporter [Sphingobium sp. 3R8]|uniref:DMT family transporter n=1 Tax=Sphingobium sp. 3R8 TaxID=2874921 RepID=UPI001CCAD89B|nr:DMT family transporter [Sphingobium sp. 3R8]MBZ9650256.1 DMT family transporter [Sphingobium sp. 3R8]
MAADMLSLDRGRAIGFVYGCGVVALFSSFVIVSRAGYGGSLDPADLAALRFGTSGILLMPLVIRRRLLARPLEPLVGLALMGGLGFALLAYLGFSLAPASHGAVMLHGTLPLTTAFLTWATTGIRPRGGQSSGFVLLLAGVLLVAGDGIVAVTPKLLLGDMCLLLASLCWSGYGLFVRRLGLPAIEATAAVAVVSALLFFPAYALLADSHLARAAVGDVALQVLFQGVLIGTLSIFVFTRAVTLLGATTISLFTAAVPALTTAAAYVLLGEDPSRWAMLGMAIMSVGMVLALGSLVADRAGSGGGRHE